MKESRFTLRRRVGKTFLLRRLAEGRSGVYSVAYEEDRALALRGFGIALATMAGVDVAVRDWEHGFDTLVALAGLGRSPAGGDGAR